MNFSQLISKNSPNPFHIQRGPHIQKGAGQRYQWIFLPAWLLVSPFLDPWLPILLGCQHFLINSGVLRLWAMKPMSSISALANLQLLS